ncbi:MAG: hypothetical protein ACRDSR_16350 [Pseudonocardiaceae bacterium]
MTAPLPENAVHLLAADGFAGTQTALCGAPVPTSCLPPCCPPDCDCSLYCSDCVHVITSWHTETDRTVPVNGSAT